MSPIRSILRVLILLALVAGLGVLGGAGVAHAQSLSVTQPNETGMFDGRLRGTAAPHAAVQWTITPATGSPVSGTVMADADGRWEVETGVSYDPNTHLLLDVKAGDEQLAQTSITWDWWYFSAGAPSSASTPTVSVTYSSERNVTVQAKDANGLNVGPSFPVTASQWLSTFQWRPPTPPSSTVTYANIHFEATDDSTGTRRSSFPFTLTHTNDDQAGLQISLTNNGVVTADGTDPGNLTATVTLDGQPAQNFEVTFPGQPVLTTDSNGIVVFTLPPNSMAEMWPITAKDPVTKLTSTNYVVRVPANSAVVDLAAYAPNGLYLSEGTFTLSAQHFEQQATVGAAPVIVPAGHILAMLPYTDTGFSAFQTADLVPGTRTRLLFRTDLLVRGASDGRGIAPTYAIEGLAPSGSQVTGVEYVVNGNWETGTTHVAQVDAHGRFVLTGALADGLDEGTTVPVRVRPLGETNWDISFQARLDRSAPAEPAVTATPVDGGVAFELTGSVQDNLFRNIDHLVLQYTTDSYSPSPRWDTITLAGDLTQPADANASFDAFWVPPQTGALHQLRFRVAAVDYAGHQSPWSAVSTVSVSHLTVGLETGTQVLTPYTANPVTVVVAAGGAPLEHVSVTAGDQTMYTGADGKAALTLYPYPDQTLSAVVQLDNGQRLATLPFFAPASDTSQGAVSFYMAGLNGVAPDLSLQVVQNQMGRYVRVAQVRMGADPVLVLPAGTYEVVATADAPGTDDPVTHLTRSASYYVHSFFTVSRGAIQGVDLQTTGLASLSPGWTVTDHGSAVTPDSHGVAITPLTMAPNLPPTELPANAEILANSGSYALRYNFRIGADVFSVARTAMTGDAPTFALEKANLVGITPDMQDGDGNPRPADLSLSDPNHPQIALGGEAVMPGGSLWVEPGTYQIEAGLAIPVGQTVYHYYFDGPDPVTLSAGDELAYFPAGGWVDMTIDAPRYVSPGGVIGVTFRLDDEYGNPLTRIVTESSVAPGANLMTERDGVQLQLEDYETEPRLVGAVGFNHTAIIQMPMDLHVYTGYVLAVEIPELGPFANFTRTTKSLSIKPGISLVAQVLPSPGSHSVNGSLLPGEPAQLVVRAASMYNPAGYDISNITGSISLVDEVSPAISGVQLGPKLEAAGLTVQQDGPTKITINPGGTAIGLHLSPGDVILTASMSLPESGFYGSGVDWSGLQLYVDGQPLVYDDLVYGANQVGSVLIGHVISTTGSPVAMAWLSTTNWTDVGSTFQFDNAADYESGSIVVLRSGYLPSVTAYNPSTTVEMPVDLKYGDVNGDNQIDAADVDAIATYLHRDPGALPLNPSGSGQVGLKDLVLAARNAGETTGSSAGSAQLTVTVNFGEGEAPSGQIYLGVYGTNDNLGTRVPVALKPVTLEGTSGTVTFTGLPEASYHVNLAIPGYACLQDDYAYTDNPYVDLSSTPAAMTLECYRTVTVVVRHPGTTQSQQFAVVRGDYYGGEVSRSNQYGYPWADLTDEYDWTVYPSDSWGVIYAWDGAGQETFTLDGYGDRYSLGVQNRTGGSIDPGTTLTVYYGDSVVAQYTAADATGTGSEWLAATLELAEVGPPTLTPVNAMESFTDKPTATMFGDSR